MEDKTQSQNLNSSDFEAVESTPSLRQDFTPSSPGKIQEGTNAFNELYQNFKGDIPFAISFVSIVGYIVIAGFGHIIDWSDLVRYVVLLFTVVLLHKFIRKEVNVSLNTVVPWVLFILFAVFVIVQNHVGIFNFLRKIL